MTRCRVLCALIVSVIPVLVVSSACQSKLPPANINSPISSPVKNSDAHAVSFKIQELSRREVNSSEEVTWLASHESTTGVARFQISLVLKKPSGDPPMAISTGAFIRENNSQYSEFLRQVAKALEANNVKARKSKSDRLDFSVAILGQNLNRGSGSDAIARGFTSRPEGNWLATKVFLADGEGEFFLNLNSKEGLGEISMKDPDYGDIVLKELSRIF